MSVFVDANSRLHHDQERSLALNCPHCQVYSHITAVSVPQYSELVAARPSHVGVVYRCDSCNAPIFLRLMARLAEAEHAKGIRLMGDLTTNHCGNTHEWFQAALADPDSPEAKFFFFTEYPHKYEAWWGMREMPIFDHRSPELRRRFYDGPDSVVARAEAFLRMHRSLPAVPLERPFRVVAPAMEVPEAAPLPESLPVEGAEGGAEDAPNQPLLAGQDAGSLVMFDLGAGAQGSLGEFYKPV